jgi:hypothetical protein
MWLTGKRYAKRTIMQASKHTRRPAPNAGVMPAARRSTHTTIGGNSMSKYWSDKESRWIHDRKPMAGNVPRGTPDKAAPPRRDRKASKARAMAKTTEAD